MKKKKTSSPLTKGYLVKEQEMFHKNHPNAEMLIKVFLTAFIVLLFLFFRNNALILAY